MTHVEINGSPQHLSHSFFVLAQVLRTTLQRSATTPLHGFCVSSLLDQGKYAVAGESRATSVHGPGSRALVLSCQPQQTSRTRRTTTLPSLGSGHSFGQLYLLSSFSPSVTAAVLPCPHSAFERSVDVIQVAYETTTPAPPLLLFYTSLLQCH